MLDLEEGSPFSYAWRLITVHALTPRYHVVMSFIGPEKLVILGGRDASSYKP